MTRDQTPAVHELWAHFRFSVVGHLLASPPRRGELQRAIEQLAARTWAHPVTREPVRFGASTIERWFLEARRSHQDPVGALRKKVRKDQGLQVTLGDPLRRALLAQYGAHRSWSVQLHFDNLVAAAEAKAELRPVPSYSTVRRFMKANGLVKRRRLSSARTAGVEAAEARLDELEVRSYEAEYVHGLWHLDFHNGSKKVLTPRGELAVPLLLGILDDRSRLACHLQWYLGEETAAILTHGLSQAFQKRSLPRALMTDGGSAMKAAETREGLARLGILHEMTLAHSPYQNGKQENFWTQVEGRLLAMLEDVADLTLDVLNDVTQAWVEHEYNRKVHSEIGEPPLSRFLAGPEVGRPSPDSAALRLAFTRGEARTQRRSDGTVSIEGRRFEVPSRYRHLERVHVRYAEWDLTVVHLVDERTGSALSRLYPLDKTRNASAARRTLEPLAVKGHMAPVPPATGVPPLLAKLLAKQAASGLPPAYLPHHHQDDEEGEEP